MSKSSSRRSLPVKTLIDQARPLAYLMFFGALATAAFSNSLFEITSSVFLGLWLVDSLARRRGLSRGGWWVWALAAYLLINLASALQPPWLYEGFKGAFRVLRWVLLTVAVTEVVDSREKLVRAYWAILAVAVFIGVDAMAQVLTGVEILRNRSMTAFYGQTHRVTGPFPHANDFSAYLCLAVLAFASAFAGEKNRPARRGLYGAGLALTLTCLALTYSRGAWIAVVLSFLLWAFLRRSIWPLVLIALFVAGAYLKSPFLFQERMQSLVNLWGGTVTERRLLWDESVSMIRERPFLGFGVNTYSRHVERFKDPSVPTDRQYAHNGYLHIGAEIGLLGLASFVLLLGYFFTVTGCVFFARSDTFADAGTAARGLWLGLVAFLIQSATDTTLQSLLLCGMLWMWLGLGWSAYRVLKTRP